MRLKLVTLLLLLSSVLVFSTTVSAANTVDKMGDQLLKELTNYNETIDNGDISEINDIYDEFTKNIKNLEKKIGKVSGSSKRKALNTKYIRPSKVAVERTIYEVTLYRLLDDINENIEQKEFEQAEDSLQVLKRVKRRAIEIKEAGGYKDLPTSVNVELKKYEDTLKAKLIAEQNFSDDLEIHHINVGQGDSTLIISETGRTMLIDAGERSAGEKVVSYLKKAGITTIDKFVLTHAHEDHIGGAVEVMENFEVKQVLDSGIPHTSKTYLDYLSIIDKNNIDFVVPSPGDKIDLDPSLNLLVVNSGMSGDDLNDASISILLRYNQFTYLTTGDAEEKAENRIVKQFNISADVLKVGHHGSNTSTNPYFLSKVQPQDAIISYGVGNSYGHPHEEVLQLLADSGVEHLHTTAAGDVVLTSDGLSYTIYSDDSYELNPVEPNDPIDSEPSFPININTADYETLQYITGVGDVIAQRIIDYRNTHGLFKSIEEIKNVKGIGNATFEKMKNQITV